MAQVSHARVILSDCGRILQGWRMRIPLSCHLMSSWCLRTLKGAALIKMAFSIPERGTIEEMTQATFKCTTQYFPLHPSLISSISCRHTVCASHVVKSATHKLRSPKYLRRYTRDVHMHMCPPLRPVSANTDASKRKQTVRQTFEKFSSTKFYGNAL